MLGAAMAARITITATVIISSTKVKPRLPPGFRNVVWRCDMETPRFDLQTLSARFVQGHRSPMGGPSTGMNGCGRNLPGTA
jgi:hypothetical protein